jgi:hypothetical protein
MPRRAPRRDPRPTAPPSLVRPVAPASPLLTRDADALSEDPLTASLVYDLICREPVDVSARAVLRGVCGRGEDEVLKIVPREMLAAFLRCVWRSWRRGTHVPLHQVRLVLIGAAAMLAVRDDVAERALARRMTLEHDVMPYANARRIVHAFAQSSPHLDHVIPALSGVIRGTDAEKAMFAGIAWCLVQERQALSRAKAMTMMRMMIHLAVWDGDLIAESELRMQQMHSALMCVPWLLLALDAEALQWCMVVVDHLPPPLASLLEFGLAEHSPANASVGLCIAYLRMLHHGDADGLAKRICTSPAMTALCASRHLLLTSQPLSDLDGGAGRLEACVVGVCLRSGDRKLWNDMVGATRFDVDACGGLAEEDGTQVRDRVVDLCRRYAAAADAVRSADELHRLCAATPVADAVALRGAWARVADALPEGHPTCPITLQPIVLPAVVGMHAFEASALRRWLGDHAGTNPMTNEPLTLAAVRFPLPSDMHRATTTSRKRKR